MKFEYKGFTFNMVIDHDDFMEEPWHRGDHGFVSRWTTRSKRPWERVLQQEGVAKLFYDVRATMKKAREEGWGLNPEEKDRLTLKLGREPTLRCLAARAVDLDFEHLKKYCNGEWSFMALQVNMVGQDFEPECIGGIEYGKGVADDTYVQHLAEELADNLLRRYYMRNHFRIASELCC
jgi:hypothetical protein